MRPGSSTALSTARPFWNHPSSKKASDTVSDLAGYPLLFRISHKNSGSHYFQGHGVVASEHYSIDAETGKRHMNNTIGKLCERTSGSTAIHTDKLVKYLLYCKNERTNFVSTTLSFSWALFFAEMNANNWKEEDVEFLVIDTLAVAHRAWVTRETLNNIGGKRNNPTYRKILNAACSSQEVIIMDCVPESAILSRTRWDDLKKELPSWFYGPLDCTGSLKFIPVPNDKLRGKYTRWQKAVQERRYRLEVLSSLRLETTTSVSHSEVTAFVLAVLSPKATSDAGVKFQNGRKTQEEFRDMAQSIARALLEWSGVSSYYLFHAEDLVHIPKVDRDLTAEKSPGADTSCPANNDPLFSLFDIVSTIGILCGKLSGLIFSAR